MSSKGQLTKNRKKGRINFLNSELIIIKEKAYSSQEILDEVGLSRYSVRKSAKNLSKKFDSQYKTFIFAVGFIDFV